MTRAKFAPRRFSPLAEGACDEQLLQCLYLAHQIEPRPQTAKFLRNERMAARIHVLRQGGVRIPILVLAPLQDGLKNRVALPNPAGRIHNGDWFTPTALRPSVENRGAREIGLRETILAASCAFLVRLSLVHRVFGS